MWKARAQRKIKWLFLAYCSRHIWSLMTIQQSDNLSIYVKSSRHFATKCWSIFYCISNHNNGRHWLSKFRLLSARKPILMKFLSIQLQTVFVISQSFSNRRMETVIYWIGSDTNTDERESESLKSAACQRRRDNVYCGSHTTTTDGILIPQKNTRREISITFRSWW